MKNFVELVKNQGLRWIVYRSQYEFKKRIGMLEKNYPKEEFDSIEISVFESNNNLINLYNNINFRDIDEKSILDQANKIVENKFCFFSNKWIEINNINWHYNYFNNKSADANVHWSKINDLNSEFGDIKLIWELSRFSFVYPLAKAYKLTREEKYSEKIWGMFEDFYKNNPPELGVNYKCSQEMSIRLFALIYAANLTSDSNVYTKTINRKLIRLIIQHVRHIYKHINFSIESVKNNHSISEATALFLIGCIFRNTKEGQLWYEKGKKLLEKEINWQIYEDGSYIQHSHNYHRLVIQDLTFVKLIADKFEIDFSSNFLKKARSTLIFLLKHCSVKDGMLPNYGMNDGAYIFPANTAEYFDYRPSLNAFAAVFFKEVYFVNNSSMELIDSLGVNKTELKISEFDLNSYIFKNGGYIVSKKLNQIATTRCASYKHRPAQADMLHVDFRIGNNKILIDAGTYSYNTSLQNLLYFNGTKSHNTLFFNNKDQMRKGPRFIWYEWLKSRLIKVEMELNKDEFIGQHYGYSPVKYIREIVHQNYNLTIKDKVLNNNKLLPFSYHFLLGIDILSIIDKKAIFRLDNGELWSIEFFSESDFKIKKTLGKQSLYYNSFKEMSSIELEFIPKNENVEVAIVIKKEEVINQ